MHTSDPNEPTQHRSLMQTTTDDTLPLDIHERIDRGDPVELRRLHGALLVGVILPAPASPDDAAEARRAPPPTATGPSG